MGGAADPDQASAGGFGGRRGGLSSRSEDRKIGYGVKVIREWNGVSGDLSGVADMVQAKVQPWEDVLRILPIEEQAHLLAKHFPADVIWEAFADHRYEGWIPEHVERAVNQSVSAASPGVPPAAAPAAPAAPPAPAASPVSGWGAQRADEGAPAADPLARPEGPASTTEVDPTVPEGLPVDDIASAMGAPADAPRTRADIVAEARRAVSDE